MSARARRRQRGHVALVLALGIVVALSVVGAGVVDVGLADARRIAGELRREQARSTAEDAADRAALWLHLNAARVRGTRPGGWMEAGRERWRTCDDAPPCVAQDRAEVETFDTRWSTYGPLPALHARSESAASYADAYYVARAERPGAAMPGWSTVHVIGEGRSRDGPERARVRRSFQLRPLLRRAPPSPIVSGGAATLEGAITLAAPEGVPAQTTGSGLDALTPLLGAGPADVTEVHDDCTSLGSHSHGVHRVRGECRLSAGDAIGSSAEPVLLVVDSGAVRMEGSLAFFGILVLRADTDGASTLVQSGGSSTVHGALVAARDLRVEAESLAVDHDARVFAPLMQIAGPPTEVPGSWTDHR